MNMMKLFFSETETINDKYTYMQVDHNYANSFNNESFFNGMQYQKESENMQKFDTHSKVGCIHMPLKESNADIDQNLFIQKCKLYIGRI